MDKKNDHKQDEYDFYREVMKKKPLDKRKIAVSAAGVAAGAVLFGVIAAFVFVKSVPYFRPEEEQPRVNIVEGASTDGDEENAPQQEIPEEESGDAPTDENDTTDTEIQKEPLTLQEYSDLYQQISEAASEPKSSVVVVQGFTNDVDWMNNSFEDEKQTSGFLVADTGKEYYVLTEYRVVDTVDRILVTFCDGNTVDGHFLKQDEATGLAVIKISRNDLSKETRDVIAVGELGSASSVNQGDLVLALGSPSGYPDSVVCGRVTSTTNVKSTVDSEYHLLTTDIMGNSEGSGVLVNLDGKIVGVIAQSFSGEADTGVVTALSISDLRKLIEQLSNNEDLIYLGVRGQDISSSLSQKTGIPTGIYVNSVEEDSPAMNAGIQNGDVIVKVGNESVETLSRLRTRLDQSKKDQKIKVTAMRKGAEGYVEIVFDVTLDAL
ncbi:serine protease [Blautia sp. BX19]|nr:serine protease [Blautia tarda]